MELVKLNMQDEDMMMALLPLYQDYEATISEEELEDIFPPDKFQENYEHFTDHFNGLTTYICMIDGKFKGFVGFHVDARPIAAMLMAMMVGGIYPKSIRLKNREELDLAKF
ncbi:MAG: hypothetical protein FWE34_00100 [Defluviitaleaceae bacterium]|nr:hypothetical protein [Defluviitaleaceae bacterium]